MTPAGCSPYVMSAITASFCVRVILRRLNAPTKSFKLSCAAIFIFAKPSNAQLKSVSVYIGLVYV